MFCTRGCESDEGCPGDFVCVDPSGAGVDGQCMAPPGEPAVYCDITEADIWSEDALVYPGRRAADDNTVTMSTRLGDYAAFCWRGVTVRGEFRPDTLGVTRGLGAYENGQVVRADIRMDIRLDHEVTIEIDRPQMGRFGDARTTLRTLLNLGGDGVLEMPTMRGLEARAYPMTLPRLTGELANATWDFYAVVEVESLNGHSAAIESNIHDIQRDLDLRLGEDGWALAQGLPATTRAIAPAPDGAVLVVGDGGRIAKRFGDSLWAWQPSGTERDLHGVHVHASGAAVAVGVAGVATHWDGSAWTPRETGTIATLDAVWMPDEDVAYAVAARDVLVYRGGAWSVAWTAPEELAGVWAPSEADVWVVGDAGYVARFDGATWAQVDSGVDAALSAVWGDAGGGPFIVGARGTALRAVDGALLASEAPTDRDLLAVWGDGERVWAVGRRGTIIAWDGETWSDVSNPDHRSTLYAVGGAGGNAWAMGAHELVIGPMLGLPTDPDPMDGGYLWDRMSWSVDEDLSADFSVINIGGAAGPCVVCGAYFTIPYSEWVTVLDGDLSAAAFPDMGMLSGGSTLSQGTKEVTLYRVKVDGGFDFDNTASDGFYNADWRAWATRSLTYLRW